MIKIKDVSFSFILVGIILLVLAVITQNLFILVNALSFLSLPFVLSLIAGVIMGLAIGAVKATVYTIKFISIAFTGKAYNILEDK